MYKYDAPFLFIIDTDSYAGNFERELCAYVTGFWDNETHGGDQAKVFLEEIGDLNLFKDCIMYVLTMDDDIPIYAPQCLEIEPEKKAYNSVGIFFEKEPTLELITLIRERSYKFANEGLIFDKPVKLKIIGFRLFKKITEIKEIIINKGV